jgi:hypothetical protein
MADDAGKPKKSTRWEKGGPTPNPYGRRGKPRDADSAPSKALDQAVSFKLNGKEKKSTVRERMALQLAKQALDGDKPALKILLAWEKASKTEKKAEATSAASYPLNEDDLKTIDSICERIRSTSQHET